MPDQKLHVIAFDIPDPPNYGGVIDVYYKLVHLHKSGIKVILHCFEYGRAHSQFLESICEEVLYYPRKTGILSQLSLNPYIVQSRRSKPLLNRLITDDHPILFEGLHTCYLINHPLLKNRFKIYRESNIEHHYYFHLFKAEKHFLKKLFFAAESFRLQIFEKKLSYTSLMMAVSEADYNYLKKRFPENRIAYIPSFHQNDEISIIPGKGDYILYHGNLEVAENHHAAVYLIKNVFSKISHKVIIAGKNPANELKQLASAYQNIHIQINPDRETMDNLVKNAQIHVLITFQATGLKLKLLNTLFQGRYCIVNEAMVSGTGLYDLCEVIENADEMIGRIDQLINCEFPLTEVKRRSEILLQRYSNHKNIEIFRVSLL